MDNKGDYLKHSMCGIFTCIWLIFIGAWVNTSDTIHWVLIPKLLANGQTWIPRLAKSLVQVQHSSKCSWPCDFQDSGLPIASLLITKPHKNLLNSQGSLTPQQPSGDSFCWTSRGNGSPHQVGPYGHLTGQLVQPVTCLPLQGWVLGQRTGSSTRKPATVARILQHVTIIGVVFQLLGVTGLFFGENPPFLPFWRRKTHDMSSHRINIHSIQVAKNDGEKKHYMSDSTYISIYLLTKYLLN